jgi:hypothetical protein
MKRQSSRTHWTHTSSEDVQTQVEIGWSDTEAGVVFIGTRLISGVPTYREYRGTVRIERVLTEGRGERLIEKIHRVTVSSLLGDIVGQDRTIIGAVQDYASKVLREEQAQDRREFNRRAHEFDVTVKGVTV